MMLFQSPSSCQTVAEKAVDAPFLQLGIVGLFRQHCLYIGLMTIGFKFGTVEEVFGDSELKSRGQQGANVTDSYCLIGANPQRDCAGVVGVRENGIFSALVIVLSLHGNMSFPLLYLLELATPRALTKLQLAVHLLCHLL